MRAARAAALAVLLGLAAGALLPGAARAQVGLGSQSRTVPETLVPTRDPAVPAPDGEPATRALEVRRDAPPLGQAGPVDPATYVLGPGDLLELDLWGRLSRSVVLEVSPEGRIFLSGTGPLPVSGRTLAWAQARVQALVSETFRGVRSDLRLLRLRTFKVYVIGDVERPGAFEVNPVTRASEVVGKAGPHETASRRNLELRRRDGSTLRVDLQRFEHAGGMEGNPPLLDGDVLRVPRSTTFVEANGAFAMPARYEFAAGDSLSTLLALAGGIAPSAARDRLLLVRFRGATRTESLWLDLPAVESGAENPPLQDGDRVFAAFQPEFHVLPTIEIYGEVERPGVYPLTLGRDRLSDLVRLGGGFRPMANRAAVHMIRAPESGADAEGGEDPNFERLVRLSRAQMTESEHAAFQTMLAGRRNTIRVDFDRIERLGPEVDPLLRPGDVVRVEPRLNTVRIEGQVRRPGFVDHAPGRGVDDYVRLAGGYTSRAARGSARISRMLTGQVVPVRNERGVMPGDVIYVPERRDIDLWQLVRDLLAVASQVAVIAVAARR